MRFYADKRHLDESNRNGTAIDAIEMEKLFPAFVTFTMILNMDILESNIDSSIDYRYVLYAMGKQNAGYNAFVTSFRFWSLVVSFAI